MKFPSIKYLFTNAVSTFGRFYLPLTFSFLAAGMGIVLLNNSYHLHPPFVKLLLSCLLGLSASLGGVLYAERAGKPVMKWLMPVFISALVAGYYFWLAPADNFNDYRAWLTFGVLSVIMHLWVAISPYLSRYEQNGFWRFNEILYARMLQSLLFSAALYIGLALAITACKILLRFDVDSEIYGKLWCIVMGVFNTWFFLAGVPADYEELNTEKSFPKSLKIFTQYILIPLVTLYMVILYAYGIRIILENSLPKGWVSTLVFSYSIAGLLAILLVHPLRDDKDSVWVRLFSKFFFRASLPLLALLYLAIWTRVHHYGITESRYYILIVGVWLGVISLYFIFSSGKNIRTIPLSLAIIGLFTLFGPWSVFNVSDRSQLHRLERILERNNIWMPGHKVVASKVMLRNNMEAEQLKAIIDYFIDKKHIEVMQPIFAINLDSLYKSTVGRKREDDRYDWQERNDLKNKLTAILCANEINGMTRYRNDLNFNIDQRQGIAIGGYRRMFHFTYPNYPNEQKQWIFLTPADSTEVKFSEVDSVFNLMFIHDGKTVESISLNGFVSFLKKKATQDDVPIGEMTLTGTGAISPGIIVTSIRIRHPESYVEDREVRKFQAWIMVK